MKNFYLALLVIALLACPARQSLAQASAAGFRSGTVQIGLTLSDLATDEYKPHTQGISAYGTFDFSEHLGIEGVIHIPSSIRAPDGFVEKSYLAGLRYVYHQHRYEPYGKLLVGIGSVSVTHTYLEFPGVPGTYGAIAGGGGLDIRIGKKLSVRAIDFEYQRWPGFPDHALTPSILSAGVAYRFR